MTNDEIELVRDRYRVASHDPASVTATQSYIFTSENISDTAPLFEIDVVTTHSTWWASVFGGRDGLSCIVPGPDQDVLICAAGGVPYLVNVDDPGGFEVLPIYARDVVSSPESSHIVIASFTDILVIGPTANDRWKAQGLVSDGFDEVRVGSTTVVVRGFNAPIDADVEITLDLVTGQRI